MLELPQDSTRFSLDSISFHLLPFLKRCCPPNGAHRMFSCVTALVSACFQVALLDIDICGPSIPKIMGLEGEQVLTTAGTAGKHSHGTHSSGLLITHKGVSRAMRFL